MILNFIINVDSTGLLLIGLLYASLLLSALYLIIKHERGLMLVFWLLVVLSLPFIGSLLYLAKFLMAGRPNLQA